MSHKETAIRYFTSGYNCAQSVFCSFCEELGIDLQTGIKISAPFGAGFGRQREVCGAISGMCMAAGLLFACDDPTNQQEKAALYARIQKLCGEFRRRCGSIICRELLDPSIAVTTPEPELRTADYYKKRPCAVYCGVAAEILEKEFSEKQ